MAQSKLKTLFRKTEVTQDEIDNAYLNANLWKPDTTADEIRAADPESITEAAPAPAPKKKKNTPHSIYLSDTDYKIIQDIAASYNETPHAVMQYAVRETIRKWKRTKKLKTNEDGKLRR